MRKIDKFKQTVKRANIIEKLFAEVADRNKRIAKPNYKLEDEISDCLYDLHTKKAKLVNQLLAEGVPEATLLNIVRTEKANA